MGGAALALALALSPVVSHADTVEAMRMLRTGTIIGPADVRLSSAEPRRTELDRLDQAVGMQVRASIRQGRKIRESDLRYPILVKRNQLVDIVYRRGTLVIRGEGRALRDGGIGEAIRVQNLDSRMIITGRVGASGQVEVSR